MDRTMIIQNSHRRLPASPKRLHECLYDPSLGCGVEISCLARAPTFLIQETAKAPEQILFLRILYKAKPKGQNCSGTRIGLRLDSPISMKYLLANTVELHDCCGLYDCIALLSTVT